MTRDEALLKLLQVEPSTERELVQVTGWGVEETLATLQRLHDAGQVTWRNGFRGGGYTAPRQFIACTARHARHAAC